MLANESSSGLKVVLRSRMDEVIQVGRGLCWLMMSGSGDRVTCTVSLDCCSATVLVSGSHCGRELAQSSTQCLEDSVTCFRQAATSLTLPECVDQGR